MDSVSPERAYLENSKKAERKAQGVHATLVLRAAMSFRHRRDASTTSDFFQG